MSRFLFVSFIVCSIILPMDAVQASKSHRSFFAKINPEFDAVKPLSAKDRSGWAMGADVLIGAFDERWVVGYSTSGRKPIWWYQAETPLTMPVAVLGSHTLLGFRDGKVAKVDIVSGKRNWEIQLDSFGARKPVLIDSTVIVMTARQQVYGLDFLSGKTKWVYDAGSPEQLSVESGATPLATSDKVYIGTSDGNVHALELSSGALLWKTSPDVAEGRFKDIIGALVLHGDQLLVSRYDGLAAALTVKDSLPQVVWKHRLPAIGTSTYRDGRIYYGTLNGEVHAMNASTGKMVWMTETGQSVAHLTATERGLVVVGTNGRVIYLSSDAGKMHWHDDVGGMVSTEPMASQQEVYILTGNKAIYGMRLEH